MCITSFKAKLIDTLTGAWNIKLDNQTRYRITAYCNTPQDLSNPDEDNCMILPIDSIHELTPENIIDTSEYPGILENLNKSLKPGHLSRSITKSTPSRNFVAYMGVYELFVINDLNSINELLEYSGRDSLKESYINFYKYWYPNWPLLLCHMNKEANGSNRSSDIFVKSIPHNWNAFNIITLEGHGTLPKPYVGRSHYDATAIVGWEEKSEHARRFSHKIFKVTKDRFPQIMQQWLPNYAMRRELIGYQTDADGLVLVKNNSIHFQLGMYATEMAQTA